MNGNTINDDEVRPGVVENLEQHIRRVTTAIAVAGLLILLVLAVFTLMDGLLRAFANAPIDLVREVGDLVAALAATCCLPIVILERGNIALKIWDGIVPQSVVNVIDFMVACLTLVVLTAMSWQFWLFGMKALQAHDSTMLFNIPKAPFWFVMAGTFSFTVLAQLVLLLRAAAAFRTVRS